MPSQITLPGRAYAFNATDERDARNKAGLDALPALNPDPFGSCENHGHVTASALVTDRSREHVLLVHHAKLDLWLPPGGHCDGDDDLVRVCRREVREETGLDDLTLLAEAILDIDIHTIPARKSSREHLHYDVRFAFEADMSTPLILSAESKDLRWVSIRDIGAYTALPSVLVPINKLRAL